MASTSVGSGKCHLDVTGETSCPGVTTADSENRNQVDIKLAWLAEMGTPGVVVWQGPGFL